MEFIKSKKNNSFLFFSSYYFDFRGQALICMDLGHLTLKRGTTSIDKENELNAIREAKVCTRKSSHSFIHEFSFCRISMKREKNPIHNLN